MSAPFAFPVSPEIWATHHDFCGMTLRDWFAGQALVGLLSSSTYNNAGEGFEAFIAEKVGLIADAMLAERTTP